MARRTCGTSRKRYFDVWFSPRCFVFHFVKSAELRAPREGSVGEIQQGWRGMRFTQRRARQESFLSDTPCLLERLSCSKCEQCAKVDPIIAVRSVRERSTRCNRLQFSQAAGPTKLKSDGRSNWAIPDPRKQLSGVQRVRFAGSTSVLSKLTCRSALHLSKACGET